MGTSNISDVGKIFVQSQAVKAGVATAEEDVKVAFTEVMGQMTGLLGESLGAGVSTGNTGKEAFTCETGTSCSDYDKYQYREMEIRESTGKNWKEDDQATKEVETFEEGVKDVLKEELGVSEEQIKEAMETLGLTFADLMNPNQLATLVAELTGTTDMSALLCSNEFQMVMQTVNELGENLLQQLGVTAEELQQLLTDVFSQVEETPSAMQGLSVEDTDTSERPVNVTNVAGQEEKFVAETAADETLSEVVVTQEESTEDTEDMTQADAEMMPEAADMPKKEQQTAGNGQNFQNQDPHTMAGQTAATGMEQTETLAVQGAESASEFSSQLDVSNIIRQIVEFTKVTVASNATTMEMQLNPENLGKIYLEITSKGGVVSAHITAQNETVKEALESQIADLRQNMNQAGVKVDAVEVTVGGHEFEKNLEQNAKQEERQAEEREKSAKQTRHINLNDLDELSGLMTEEEALVAQMMADQGNTVDFTA